MADFDVDLLVVGGGSGGVRAARVAAGLGARVALVEADRLGGTCVNVGCVPKKLLVYGASFADAFVDAAGFGWTVPPPTLDWSTLRDRKDTEILRLNGIYGRLLADAGVRVIHGHGRLTGAHAVTVAGVTTTAAHILIATGGQPTRPDVPGAELGVVSDDLFTLPALPERAVIVGGGYIGVEFAGILHGLGVAVTLVLRDRLLLRGFDHELRVALGEQMAKRGIRIVAGRGLRWVERGADGGRVVVLDDGQRLDCDLVLLATGRTPHTAGLGLTELGVTLTARGAVVVDDDFVSSVPSILAVGDVTDRLTLTPVALAEGMVVARRLFGGPLAPVSYRNVPTAVFSQPNVATVGLTEEQARSAVGAVRVYVTRFRPLKHTMSGRDEQSFFKLVVDDASDRVLGVHVLGPDAGEIVQGFAVALTCGATKAQLDATIGIHPTAAEELVTMRTARPAP